MCFPFTEKPLSKIILIFGKDYLNTLCLVNRPNTFVLLSVCTRKLLKLTVLENVSSPSHLQEKGTDFLPNLDFQSQRPPERCLLLWSTSPTSPLHTKLGQLSRSCALGNITTSLNHLTCCGPELNV